MCIKHFRKKTDKAIICPENKKNTRPVGFFMRFFFLSGYFSNYFCSRHDNHDIVIISGPTEAVSVLFSFLFS
jgi:hypothetical protein